jgi:hypothetical protein
MERPEHVAVRHEKRGYRRLVGATGAALVVAVLLLARPAPTVACAGCPIPLSDVVKESGALFVATSDGPLAGRTYRLTVDVILKGAVPGSVTYRAVPAEPAMPRGSRWIIVVYPAGMSALRTGMVHEPWDQAWPVASDGRIDLPGLVVAPATLTAFLAWFGLPATSTEPVSTRSGPPVTVILGGVAAAAFFAAWRWPRHLPLSDIRTSDVQQP